MNRLRIKLSEKRAISLDIPDLKKKFWPFYLAELVQYLALLVSVSLFVIGQFDDDFDNIDFTYCVEMPTTADLGKGTNIIQATLCNDFTEKEEESFFPLIQ